MERTFKVRHEGEEQTAAFALWVNLTREQVAIVENVAGGDVSARDLLRRIALDAIEAKIPGIGKLYRRDVSDDSTEPR
jgi:hypothetical protein